MADETMWIERAQSAEARLKTLEQAMKPAIERVQQFKANFGLRERQNGEIVIDYDRFVEALGPSGALELRSAIDERYGITGGPGQKPRMRVGA